MADFFGSPPHYRQHDLVQHGCREIGLSPAQAREEIAPERVREFIERGATAVRYPGWTLVVDGGSVVTVLPHGKRRNRGCTQTGDENKTEILSEPKKTDFQSKIRLLREFYSE